MDLLCDMVSFIWNVHHCHPCFGEIIFSVYFYFEKCRISQVQVRAFVQILFVHNDYRFLCMSVSQCKQPPVFKGASGKIQSPRYPEPYLPNQLKHWHLRTHKGFQIQLSLAHLDIKASPGCSQDSLTVRVTLMPKRTKDSSVLYNNPYCVLIFECWRPTQSEVFKWEK